MLAAVVCTVELRFSAVTTTSATGAGPSAAGAVSACAFIAKKIAELLSSVAMLRRHKDVMIAPNPMNKLHDICLSRKRRQLFGSVDPELDIKGHRRQKILQSADFYIST
jgi:hypothetical protein